MSARRADRLFARYAPNVIFPNRSANLEQGHLVDSGIHDPIFHAEQWCIPAILIHVSGSRSRTGKGA